MFFRMSVLTASLILLAGVLAAQEPTSPQSRVDVGNGGQIVLSSTTKDSGNFTLIDRRGKTTHSGVWKKEDGHLAWTSKTGEPAIQGSTYWIDGAWRVYWKVIPTVHNPVSVSGSTSFSVRRAPAVKGGQEKTQPGLKKGSTPAASERARLVAKKRSTQVSKPSRSALAGKSKSSAKSKKARKLILCFESIDGEDKEVKKKPQPTTVVAFRDREYAPKKRVSKKQRK